MDTNIGDCEICRKEPELSEYIYKKCFFETDNPRKAQEHFSQTGHNVKHFIKVVKTWKKDILFHKYICQ